MAFEFHFSENCFLLLPEKAIFWSDEKTLILADLHLGKANHFRKQGLAIPHKSSHKDYEVLKGLISHYQPNKVLILGDLFHSEYNSEWEIFGNFISINKSVQFQLVIGNHDILPIKMYHEIELEIVGEIVEIGNLIFSHHPLKITNAEKLNFSGHIHPGFRLQGIGRQAITMPCFYHKKSNFILPAFGSLTGLKILKKEANTSIYGISGTKIFKL